MKVQTEVLRVKHLPADRKKVKKNKQTSLFLKPWHSHRMNMVVAVIYNVVFLLIVS